MPSAGRSPPRWPRKPGPTLGTGNGEPGSEDPGAIEIAPASPSSELRVDRRADLVERLALLVQPIREASLTLTDLTVGSHAVRLVAREQGILAFEGRATALTPDAVDDLGNLAHHVE